MEESETQFDMMAILSDPKKMNALLNVIALFQKAQSIHLDLSIWVNGVPKAEVEDALKDLNIF